MSEPWWEGGWEADEFFAASSVLVKVLCTGKHGAHLVAEVRSVTDPAGHEQLGISEPAASDSPRDMIVWQSEASWRDEWSTRTSFETRCPDHGRVTVSKSEILGGLAKAKRPGAPPSTVRARKRD